MLVLMNGHKGKVSTNREGLYYPIRLETRTLHGFDCK